MTYPTNRSEVAEILADESLGTVAERAHEVIASQRTRDNNRHIRQFQALMVVHPICGVEVKEGDEPGKYDIRVTLPMPHLLLAVVGA